MSSVQAAPPKRASLSTLTKLKRQVRYNLLIFRRNTAGAFFTVVLPLIFLVIFTSIFGNETLDNGVKVATLYVPGILAMAIVSATTNNLAITITTRRERGVLKRVKGTPLPTWIYVLAEALTGAVVAALMTVIIIVVGRIAFGVELNLHSVPTLVLTVLIGATALSFVGLALTTVIPSEDAAPAITNALMLPLYFVSDIFIVGDATPDWVTTVGNLFPIRHLNVALQDSFNPFVTSTTWPWRNWLVIALWGLAGAAITSRRFRWTPRR